jgi:hypothetical protein
VSPGTFSPNSLNKNSGGKDYVGVKWLPEWIRNYYSERGYAGEALENAVKEALDSTRDLKARMVVFKVKVTDDAFSISPNNLRYLVETSLSAIASEIDEKTKKSVRKGLINPILVKPAEEYGKWCIIAGVRRAAALLEEYADIRIYQPRDAVEEALLSLEENLIREEMNELEYDLVAVKAQELGDEVKKQFYEMIDPKTRKRLEMADKPVELVQVEPPYAPYTPAKKKKNAGVKNAKPFQAVRYVPVHGPEGELNWDGTPHNSEDELAVRCPYCGRPLKCAGCGSLVR